MRKVRGYKGRDFECGLGNSIDMKNEGAGADCSPPLNRLHLRPTVARRHLSVQEQGGKTPRVRTFGMTDRMAARRQPGGTGDVKGLCGPASHCGGSAGAQGKGETNYRASWTLLHVTFAGVQKKKRRWVHDVRGWLPRSKHALLAIQKTPGRQDPEQELSTKDGKEKIL